MSLKNPFWVTHTSNHLADTFNISCRDVQLLLLTVFWGNLFVPHVVLQQHGSSNMQYAKAVSNIKNSQGFDNLTAEVSWDMVRALRLIRQQVFDLTVSSCCWWQLHRLCVSTARFRSFVLSGRIFSLHLSPMLTSRQPNPPTATTTKIVLSDSIGNAASAGLGSCLQDYNMICEHVNTSWIKQRSLHASQQKSLMEQLSVWIRETEEHNFSLRSTVLLSFFQLNQIRSIFKV